MAQGWRYGLIEYDVPGLRVVHEGWMVAHVEGEDYIVVTPDEDIFCETMSVLNDDLRAFRARPGHGRLPAGVAANVVYELPNWNPGELARLRAAAEAEATAEKARRGVGVVPAAVPVPAIGAGAGNPTVQAEGADEEPPSLSRRLPGLRLRPWGQSNMGM